jgi:putative transposase
VGFVTVQLVEQHLIKQDDPRFAVIDRAAFASKNLYNQATYLIRQAFIFENRYLGLKALYALLKRAEPYCALPRKVSNQVLLQVGNAWRSFFKALAAWKEDPTRFLGRPCIPGYKPKAEGRNLLVYERLSGLNLTIPTQQQAVDQVRIVPRKGHYVVEVVYSVTPEPVVGLDDSLVAGIDIGLDNLAALTSNKPGFQPIIVNGKPLKSLNQYYNKKKAHLQSRLPRGRHTSHQIIRPRTLFPSLSPSLWRCWSIRPGWWGSRSSYKKKTILQNALSLTLSRSATTPVTWAAGSPGAYSGPPMDG